MQSTKLVQQILGNLITINVVGVVDSLVTSNTRRLVSEEVDNIGSRSLMLDWGPGVSSVRIARNSAGHIFWRIP
jgi:hypothetical protein